MKHGPAMSTSEDEILKRKCNVDRQCQYKYSPALMTICLVTISCASLYKYHLSSKITANDFGPGCMEVTDMKHIDENAES